MNTEQTDNQELNRIVSLSYCYDFYGVLLKQQYREIFEDYIGNDMSLGEIAAERKMTRQGVHDIIKRCSRKLEEYEEKLCLVEKFRITKMKLDRIETIASRENSRSSQEIVSLTHDIIQII